MDGIKIQKKIKKEKEIVVLKGPRSRFNLCSENTPLRRGYM